MTIPFVELSKLNHSYRGGGRQHRVLDDVSLSVQRGQTLALLGRSGSGKSTLLNLVAGIDRPDSGEVRVAGELLTALGEAGRTRFRRRHVGFVYQFFNLIPTLTAAENVGLALELNGEAPRSRDRRVAELLDILGLSARGRYFPEQLSGGEQQRVAIARALAHRPALVLADEPTGNLDADSGAQVLVLLREQVAAQQATLLLVTHSLAVAEGADRVLTLDRGQLRERQGEFAW